MTRRPVWGAAPLAAALLASAAALGQPATAPAGDVLTVAVWEAPPFAEQGPDGTWAGLAVELAGDVGQALGRPVRVVGVPEDGALAAAASGRADLALVDASPAAEARADLTGAFYTARLGAAREHSSRLTDVAGRFFSGTFLRIALALAVLLLVVGAAMWALERRRDADDSEEGDFGEGAAGIWDGFWWAGVTMTTIGYGDTVPTSTGGRALALVWMLVSMAVTAALTAALVSALGLESGGALRVPDDLRGERVGVVEGSTAARVLAESRVDARPVASLAAAVDAVRAGSLDVVVDAVPRLRAALGSASELQVQVSGVDVERWAFAVAEGSPLREPVARAVLDRLQSPDWRDAVRRYVPAD